MYIARVLFAITMLALSNRTYGGESACPECGCCEHRVVCRLVCVEEEVKEHRWKCECEDFCIPGPSHVCDEDCQCDNSKRSGFWCIKIWEPSGCAKVRTRKVLVKDEAKRTVPSHKWVVEEVCDRCGCALNCLCETPVQAGQQYDYNAGTPGYSPESPTFISNRTRTRDPQKRPSSKGEE